MQPPFWKKALSYLFEIHLESRSSEYNPELNVSLVDGRYQLYTEHAIYSFGDLYNNFRITFEKIALDQYAIEKVLVLGHGLGSIPYMLEKTFHKKYHYTGVEIDEEVIYLANKYVMQDLDSPQQMICADAYAYVAQCSEKFDLIAIDLFFDNIIPVKFEDLAFLEKIASLLNPGGLVLINRLADLPQAKEKTKLFFEQQFLQVFKTGRYLEVEHNWVLINQ